MLRCAAPTAAAAALSAGTFLLRSAPLLHVDEMHRPYAGSLLVSKNFVTGYTYNLIFIIVDRFAKYAKIILFAIVILQSSLHKCS